MLPAGRTKLMSFFGLAMYFMDAVILQRHNLRGSVCLSEMVKSDTRINASGSRRDLACACVLHVMRQEKRRNGRNCSNFAMLNVSSMSLAPHHMGAE